MLLDIDLSVVSYYFIEMKKYIKKSRVTIMADLFDFLAILSLIIKSISCIIQHFSKRFAQRK